MPDIERSAIQSPLMSVPARLRRFYWQRIRRYSLELCHRGRPVGQVWSADEYLFKKINGSPYGCWCIRCFDAECKRRGLHLRWKPRPLR